MLCRLLLIVALIACAREPRAPAWPAPSATEDDGGESIAPRDSAATAVETEKEKPKPPDDQSTKTPPAATTESKPVTKPAPTNPQEPKPATKPAPPPSPPQPTEILPPPQKKPRAVNLPDRPAPVSFSPRHAGSAHRPNTTQAMRAIGK